MSTKNDKIKLAVLSLPNKSVTVSFHGAANVRTEQWEKHKISDLLPKIIGEHNGAVLDAAFYCMPGTVMKLDMQKSQEICGNIMKGSAACVFLTAAQAAGKTSVLLPQIVGNLSHRVMQVQSRLLKSPKEQPNPPFFG